MAVAIADHASSSLLSRLARGQSIYNSNRRLGYIRAIAIEL